MRFAGWFLALILAVPYTANVSAAPERFVLDPSHVSIGFLVGHARFAQVLGLFSDVSGEFVYDAETPVMITCAGMTFWPPMIIR
jgi:polyisoprenoid-binding protein YceI